MPALTDDTYRCDECAAFNEKYQDSPLRPRRLAERHRVDRAHRRYRIGDRVTVPAEKCPCCDNFHGITDWSGVVTEFEHPAHVNLPGPGPFYVIAMVEGSRIYAEAELKIA